jgi:hypothetical protein
VASWFVAKDAPQFGIIANGRRANFCSCYRGGTGILARRWRHILNRLHKPPSNYGWWGNSGDEADLLRCRVLTESEHK